MKTAIVNSKDVFDKEKNPTLCLSALRYTGGCHKCPLLKRLITRKGMDLEEAVKTIACDPIITRDIYQLHEERKALVAEKRRLQSEINGIDGRL